MDIRILRDGTEIGPFPEETVQTLLQQGSIAITDLAWCPGLPQWVPLANLLYASDTPPPPPGSVPPPPPIPQAAEVPFELPQVTAEPATAKQKAFLTYMGVAFAAEIDREDASSL